MPSFYYRDEIQNFVHKATEEIIGEITLANQFDGTIDQTKSWEIQIPILKKALKEFEGTIFFEFSIPRMGKRIDVLLVIKNVVFVIEFKVGEFIFRRADIDQVWDYALDLKNFHKPSHEATLVPILIATEAEESSIDLITTSHDDNLFKPLTSNGQNLILAIQLGLAFNSIDYKLEGGEYASGSYSPTPTIIEAALSLYNNHSVDEITRSDAAAENLTKTTGVISDLIHDAKAKGKKIICFVTGVPGAGKTLVGLKVATTHLDEENANASVYLSGNGPLVMVLQEALARDKVRNEKEKGNKIRKSEAQSSVKAFIQNIHHYRDAYIEDPNPPYDHVAIFDEAQRAWTREKTIDFMKRRKGISNFEYSEPEFLISCLDRHSDWAVIICLVGGGQEINTGEAGISAWLSAIKHKFNGWEAYISPNLTDSEYAAIEAIEKLKKVTSVTHHPALHLSVSMRSFRAEKLSLFVKQLLDNEPEKAKETYSEISDNYPIVLTRDLQIAKKWLKEKARGSERYGLVVSSQAQRLKPFAVDVNAPINPIHWFLNSKEDVRSSYYLEAVATEFHIQGLELDWACVMWDGDLRYSPDGWNTHSFKGKKWQHIRKEERKQYLLNAYRVLLTRARQGMVIAVPEGDTEDHTRKSEFYDSTFHYLKGLGLQII